MIMKQTDTASAPRCTCEETQNKSEAFDNIFLPLPPLDGAPKELMEVYARFMRHVRLAPNSNIYIKILSGIQFTADMMDMPDAMISKMLADMGLRAPRKAFPESYLDHVDRTLMRSGWNFLAPCESSIDMKRFWDDIGEDKFAAFQKDYAFVTLPMTV